jgi:hypothetical protein
MSIEVHPDGTVTMALPEYSLLAALANRATNHDLAICEAFELLSDPHLSEERRLYLEDHWRHHIQSYQFELERWANAVSLQPPMVEEDG